MKLNISLFFFLLFSTLFFAEESRVDSILASVNGIPISLFDVLLESWKEERKLSVVFRGERLKNEIQRLRKKVVQSIIERKLIFNDFQKYQYKIPRQLIEDAMGELAIDFSDGSIKGLQKKAESLGSNIAELREKAREKVAVSLIINEICYRNVFVTPKEVYEYYKDNINKFRKPSQLQIQSLFLKKGKRTKEEEKKVIITISEKLAAKVDFAELVRFHSDGLIANDGMLGWIRDDKLREEFRPVKDINKGQTAGPINTDEGIYFLHLTDKIPSEDIPFIKAKEDIRTLLELEKRKKKYDEFINELKENALIRFYF